MKRVVYLLGAGFSAPLGIPVMANFLEKAKDLYYESDTKFEHFRAILQTINDLHVANTYYATDVFNIEEVLSILDMKGLLSGAQREKEFRTFIADVISNHTPPLVREAQANRWEDLLFWARPWSDYGPFASALLGYQYVRQPDFNQVKPEIGSYKCTLKDDRPVSYSVITLNYDIVLEKAAASLTSLFGVTRRFTRDRTKDAGVPLAKLHGSVDSDDIVPPIGSKSLDLPSIRQAWKDAYGYLREANDIRIIGYSLPEADAYVRYLLRSAVIDTPNLKRIDVVCKDDDGEANDSGWGPVQRRYRDFVTFRKFRFVAGTTQAYLSKLTGNAGQWPERFDPDALEQGHTFFFGY